jgi:peptide/nickel transport system permease protein
MLMNESSSQDFPAGGEVGRWTILTARVKANKNLMVGGMMVVIFVFMAIFAPYLTSYDPNQRNFSARFAPPSFQHLMGTDHFGRDTFSRILFGTRISFEVGIVSVLIGMIIGVIIGAVAAYSGGFIDNLLMRMMDGLLAFPQLLLAIALVAFMTPNLGTVSIAIGVVFIPRFARVMRSAVLVEMKREYVEAARAIGQSGFRILFRHIGPSTISPVVVLTTLVFAFAVLTEAGLSFLGLGLPPPSPSWGRMLDEARHYLSASAWTSFFPGVAISLAVLGFNLLGDGFRDFLDPKISGVVSMGKAGSVGD